MNDKASDTARTNAEIAASMREQLSTAFIEQASGLRDDIAEVVQRVFEAGLAESNARLEREWNALRNEIDKARTVCEEIENYAMTANQSVLDDKEEIRKDIFRQIRDLARKGCAKSFESHTWSENEKLKDQLAAAYLNEQNRLGEFSKLMAELGSEQSRRLIGETSEKKLRAALLEFVHCENKFGHTGQHPEAECVDCKRVNAASDALGESYLRPAPQESVNTAKFSEPIWDSRNSNEPVELR